MRVSFIGTATTDEDRSWQDNANCLGVDPDLFFPERGASTREAKEVCRACIVRVECLEYALANGDTVERGCHRRDLREDVDAVGVFIDKSLQAADLALDPA